MGSPCKPRILIVENDPTARDLLKTVLLQEGYDVQAAEGSGEPLKAHALQIAWRFRPHVAIVDLRLSGSPELDGIRADDWGGLALLPGLSQARCILRSAYLTPEITQEALQRHRAFGVIGAQWSPQRLKSTVAAAAREACASRRGLSIYWPIGWNGERVAETVLGPGAELPPCLVEDVIAAVFRQAGRVDLGRLEGVEPSRGRSVLLKARLDSRVEPLFLKFASREQVEQETTRYAKHIKGRLRGYAHELLEEEPAISWATFWDIGAVPYTFVGAPEGELSDFARFYREHEPEALMPPLKYFFGTVWSDLYGDDADLADPLFDAYGEVLPLGALLQEAAGQESPARQAHLPDPMPDPVAWVLANKGYSDLARIRQAVTHGALGADSLFVCGSHAWAIDFERSGPGPILRDFVALEVDVITRLLALPGKDDGLFYALALLLAGPSQHPLASQPSGALAAVAGVDKGLKIVNQLRVLAHEITRYRDPREYYWGLLLHALYVALLPSPSPQKERALLLSSVLCARLEGWGSAWPPADWPVPSVQPGQDPTSGGPATRHQYHFEDLSPDDFERLIYWLVERGGKFDQVQWYGGARDKGRDVVAYKHTDSGRETWYIQAKRYQRIAFPTLRDELDKLARHARDNPDFAPDVIVFATACPVPPQAKDEAADHARALGLPEPYYWGRLELDEQLKALPDVEKEFFGLSSG